MADLGTVTVTEERVGSVKKILFDWLSENGGANAGKAQKTTTYAYNGTVARAVFVPDSGGTQPTDEYDVTVTDADGIDVLDGLGANLSNAATVTKSAGLGLVANDTLTLNVTNAGNAKGGTVTLFLLTDGNGGHTKLAAGAAAIGKLAANSGVDIGDVDVTSVTLPTTIYSGVKAVTAAGTDEVLAASQALKSGVTVKAHSTNTGTIYVGPEGVAAATGFRLAAGESVFVEVDNLADVCLDASVNGEGVSYIAS
jgi:hypothetical protein